MCVLVGQRDEKRREERVCGRRQSAGESEHEGGSACVRVLAADRDWLQCKSAHTSEWGPAGGASGRVLVSLDEF